MQNASVYGVWFLVAAFFQSSQALADTEQFVIPVLKTTTQNIHFGLGPSRDSTSPCVKNFFITPNSSLTLPCEAAKNLPTDVLYLRREEGQHFSLCPSAHAAALDCLPCNECELKSAELLTLRR